MLDLVHLKLLHNLTIFHVAASQNVFTLFERNSMVPASHNAKLSLKNTKGGSKNKSKRLNANNKLIKKQR